MSRYAEEIFGKEKAETIIWIPVLNCSTWIQINHGIPHIVPKERQLGGLYDALVWDVILPRAFCGDNLGSGLYHILIIFLLAVHAQRYSF